MQMAFDWVGANTGILGPILASALAISVTVAIALTFHQVARRVLRQLAAKSSTQADDILVRRADRPAKWILIVIAVGLSQQLSPLTPSMAKIWSQAVGLLMPALCGWLAVSLIGAAKEILELKADVSVLDNLAARRKRTRIGILTRIAVVLVLFLSVCMMLLSIPGVRNVGVTLMASAGLAGLAVGAAAQPALKNLIAGVQMAFTEPIRIDDVVIIAGEWGRIEDIRLTYVVVKIWDERRLIVPVSKFLDESFQNWTRDSAQLLGSAFFYLDPAADTSRLRGKLEEVVKANPKWDGRFFNLQVTDIKPEVMEVRALVTAADAGQAFDLRCDVREVMMRFIVDEMPEALPRRRLANAKSADAADGNGPLASSVLKQQAAS